MNAVCIPYPPPGGVQLKLDFDAPLEQRISAEIIPIVPQEDWSDHEIMVIREELLWSSLHKLGDTRSGKAVKKDVMAWLVSTEDHPFSFTVCCQALGFDADELRAEVLAMFP